MPLSREDALELLQKGEARLRALLDRLTGEQLTRPATIGGGDWSAKDLIGHVASWEEIALDSISEWQRGEKPQIEAEAFATPGGVDRLNAGNVARKQSQSLEEVLGAADETHRSLLASMEEITEEEWGSGAPFPTDEPMTLGGFLGGVLSAPQQPFGHAFAHLPDLEAYVASIRG